VVDLVLLEALVGRAPAQDGDVQHVNVSFGFRKLARMPQYTPTTVPPATLRKGRTPLIPSQG
jgi:hypothetical protein